MSARRVRVLAGGCAALCAVQAPIVVAAQYLSVEQAQRAIFPEALRFEPLTLRLSVSQRQAVEQLAGVQPPRGRLQVWRVFGAGGALGYFFSDEVVGKEDFIDYALGIDEDGTLRAPEVMAYRESHGGEIRNANWLRQFAKRRAPTTKLQAGIDIKNIAGATLSCEHLTAGIRYLAALWQIALQASAQAAS